MAQARSVAAEQMNSTTAEFGRTAAALGNSYRGAAEQARRAIDNIESTSSHAIASTRRGAEELLRTFHQEYRWSLYALTSLALVIGIGLGLSLLGNRLSLRECAVTIAKQRFKRVDGSWNN